MSYAKPILERESDPFEICCQVVTMMGGVDLAAMTAAERNVALANRMRGQINNGGFDQYFFNDGLEYPRECLNALTTIELPKSADLLAKALDLVGEATDYNNASEEVRAALSDLDARYYRIEDEPFPQTAEYIRANVDAFGWQGDN
jgi:Arc/MetJ-type ribon-helix-helix transcriptional regulator